jgi:hypothetical protein
MRGIRKLIDVSQVKKRIYHYELPEHQIERLRKLYPVVKELFKELFPNDSVEDWINDFKYDQYPEIEIVYWEEIASKYLSETEGKNLSSKEKMEIWSKLISNAENAFPLDVPSA